MPETQTEKTDIRVLRLKILAKNIFPAALLLLAYVAFYSLTGIGFPCVFRLITGLKCPGCGMSHALSALAKGRIAEAAAFNILSVTLLPLLGIYFFIKALQYIFTGSSELRVPDIIFLLLCSIACVLFFLERNDLFFIFSGHHIPFFQDTPVSSIFQR